MPAFARYLSARPQYATHIKKTQGPKLPRSQFVLRIAKIYKSMSLSK